MRMVMEVTINRGEEFGIFVRGVPPNPTVSALVLTKDAGLLLAGPKTKKTWSIPCSYR